MGSRFRWAATFLAISMFTAACAGAPGDHFGVTTTAPGAESRTLDDAVGRWNATDADSYTWWMIDRRCRSGLCKIVVVEDGTAVRITLGDGTHQRLEGPNTAPRTVPDWFELIREKLDEGFDTDIEYHPTFGYPKRMSWDHVGWSDAGETISLRVALPMDPTAPVIPAEPVCSGCSIDQGDPYEGDR